MTSKILWGFGSESEDDPQSIGNEKIREFVREDLQ
ncbi:hypothetical protein DYBT9275_02738 [Dyadobacter sp. CECT 9275]|uniref:Uncharacterized protein n=1 Tax=Dyadobacter helix TaxID=2822344 RepID=A0A916JDL4_9BACT|nr:hypothetical protein DYBT9275_02738 [Dyadobacter sp. CECT 9275]